MLKNVGVVVGSLKMVTASLGEMARKISAHTIVLVEGMASLLYVFMNARHGTKYFF